MKQYHIERTTDEPPLRGEVGGTSWASANSLSVTEYPWEGDNPDRNATFSAETRMLYDDVALYLQYHVTDYHQQANTTELNGPVWEDSCVEVFASPDPDQRPDYINFEANCIGQFLFGFGPDRERRRLISSELATDIRVETSVAGPTKEPSSSDEDWWLATAVPFDVVGDFIGTNVHPVSGDVWRGNVHCCRGHPFPQYTVWNPVRSSNPDFHRPRDFGTLVFE